MAPFTNDYVFVDDNNCDTNALQEPSANDSNDEDDDEGSLSIQDSSYEDLNEDDDEAMSMMMHHDSFHSIRDEFERVRLDKLRRELEAIKLQGKITARQQQWELQQAQLKCHMVLTKLQEQLMERTHQSMYMRFLTYEYAEYDRKKKDDGDDDDGSKPSSATTTTTSSAPTTVSTYVLQQETPLLSIMHRAFLVMPNQMEVTQILYRKHVFSYLSKEIRGLRRKNAQASEQVVHELSSAAEENDRLYDAYQERVEEQERQLCELRRQLWHRSPKKLSLTSKAELCSETEHSETTYSEEDCTDRGCDDEEDDDDAVAASPTSTSPRFPKVTKLLLTPTERISKSLGKNVQHLRNMVAAGDKFQLPF